MMGRVPSPSISCSSAKTHLHKAGMNQPLPEQQIPGQDFTTNTSPHAAQGQTRLDRLDLGHKEHQVSLPAGGHCAWHSPPCTPLALTQASANPKDRAAQTVCCVGSGSDRPTRGTGRGKVEFTLHTNSRPPSTNTPGPRVVLGSERCHCLGQSEQALAQAGCGAHREFVKQQHNEAGQNGLCNSSSSLSSPKAGVPGSEQAYLTTSHHWPSLVPARSRNISPQCWRGDLSLCWVPADKVRRHAKTQQQVSVQRGRFSSTQRRRHVPSLGPGGGSSAPQINTNIQHSFRVPAALPACTSLSKSHHDPDPQVPLCVPSKSLPSTAPREANLTFAEKSPPVQC